MKLRVLDLFSGIGGFSLGLKRAGGFQTVGYCEIDPYCQQVLQARMRDGSLDTAPICTDVRRLDGQPWAGRVDVICGGFPCQDISNAGLRAGIDGQRSGLWREICRLVREVGPSYVFVENVSALLVRGMGRVLGDLAQLGYDAEWEMLPASAFGAPHIRRRVWILAYPHGYEGRLQPVARAERQDPPHPGNDGAEEHVAHPFRIFGGRDLRERFLEAARCSWWSSEPNVGRVADGVPSRVDRCRALGNAVVPAVVEWIGTRMMQSKTF